MQGGRIGFTSEAGKGSTFRFWVSTAKTPAPQDAAPWTDVFAGLHIEEELSGLSRQPQVDISLTAAPLVDRVSTNSSAKNDIINILVVEDNLINQKVLAKQLRRHGFSVVIANHGQEALAYIKTTSFWIGANNRQKPLSIVLMDWEMPVMDGIACVHEIRRLQSIGEIIRHVPVIGVTANARDQQLRNALSCGMVSGFIRLLNVGEMVLIRRVYVGRCMHEALSDREYYCAD